MCWNGTGLVGSVPPSAGTRGSVRARLLSEHSFEGLERFRDGSEAQGCDVMLEWGEGKDLADEQLGMRLWDFSGVGTNGTE